MKIFSGTSQDLAEFYPTREFLEFAKDKVINPDFTYSAGTVDGDYFILGTDAGLCLIRTDAQLINNLDIEADLIGGFEKLVDLPALEFSLENAILSSKVSAKLKTALRSTDTASVVIGTDGTDTDLIAVTVGGQSALPPTTLRNVAEKIFDVGTAPEPVWLVGIATSPDVLLIEEGDLAFWENGSNCMRATAATPIGTTEVSFIGWDENTILEGGGTPLLLDNTSTDQLLPGWQYGEFSQSYLNSRSASDLLVTVTSEHPYISAKFFDFVAFDLPPAGSYSHIFLYRSDPDGGDMVAFLAELTEPSSKPGIGTVGISLETDVIII